MKLKEFAGVLVILAAVVPVYAHDAGNRTDMTEPPPNAVFAKAAEQIVLGLSDLPKNGDLQFDAPKAAPFFLLGKSEADQFQELTNCDQNAAFALKDLARVLATVSVGRCTRQLDHLHEMLEQQNSRLTEMIKVLSAQVSVEGTDSTQDQEAMKNWVELFRWDKHKSSSMPGGERFYYFPVPVGGHGIGTLYTAVIAGRQSISYAQVIFNPNGIVCDGMAMCKDTEGTLTRMVQRIYALPKSSAKSP